MAILAFLEKKSKDFSAEPFESLEKNWKIVKKSKEYRNRKK